MADMRETEPGAEEPEERAGHPDPFRLEAWSVGEPDVGVDRHMEDCKECRDYVVSLEMQKEVFLDREEPDDFVKRVRRVADTELRPVVGLERPRPEPEPEPEPEPAPLPGAEDVSEAEHAALPENPAGDEVAGAPWITRMRWWLAGPAMAAAALALTVVAVRMQDPEPKPGTAPGTGTGSGAEPGNTIRIKGPLRLGAIVMGKDNIQARVSKMVYIARGIKVRIELTVPKRMAVSVGIVDNSGEWITLVEKKNFTPGVHFLPNSLAFEDRPTTARVVAGTPAQISKALETGKFKGLPTLVIQPVVTK